MLVAIFTAEDPRAGHKILYENGAFQTDAGESLSLDQMMDLDRRNGITWVTEQIRSWAHEYAASSIPPTGAPVAPVTRTTAQVADRLRLVRTRWKRLFTPTGLVLVLILFALPFLDVSCAGQKVLAISGYDLATGFAAAGGQRLGPQALLIAPLILAVAGIGLTFLRLPAQRLLLAITSAVGAGCLVAFAVEVANNVRNTTTPLVSVTVSLGSGLIGSVVLFVAVAALNAVLYVQDLRRPAVDRETRETHGPAEGVPPHPPPVTG